MSAWGPGGGSGSSAPTFAQVKTALGGANSAVDFNGQRLTGLGAPSASSDAATKASAASAAVPLLPYDPAAEAALVGAPDSPGGAGYTLGVAFVPLQSGLKCTGVRGYWAGGAGTVKLSLYDDAGNRLASGTASVSGAGAISVTFGSPVSLTAGATYRAAMYSTTSSTGAYNPNLPSGAAPTVPQRNGAVLVFDFSSASGDVNPSISSGFTYLFAVSPTLST